MIKLFWVIFMKISVDRAKRYQIFEGIGASGAWWAQLVGGWSHIDEKSNMPVRDRISQLLFSRDNGIALCTYRYNIGAGSAHSDVNKISNPLRKTESFDSDVGYDFSRDANAVYMMKQAVRDGAGEVVLFVNSPVERLTKNHKSHCTVPFADNLSPKNYKAFAKYCLDVTEHFVSEGVPVKYLSPINEPIWKWTGGQEGCHYSPRSAGFVMDCFAKELMKRPKLKGVRLSGVESADIRWFNKSYTRNLLRYPDVRRVIDSIDIHSYFLFAPLPFFNNRVAFLKRYRRWLDRNYPDMPVKMSEWTHMKAGRDKGMSSALEMARVMWEDISILNVTSWQHWIAVSEVDYCDGLIYINLDDKSFEMTKRYYATGNFSKYIPHNATRIEAKCSDSSLYLLAFEKDNKITLIVINDNDDERLISVDAVGDITVAVTDKDNDLYEYKTDSKDIVITAKSVTTIVLELC